LSKQDTNDLIKFLLPFPNHVKVAALALREFVWDLYPESNELIYDNYNAFALGWSLTDKAGDVFCGIAIYSEHVNFGFNRGSEIADPQNKLTGNGSLYRYIRIKDKDDFPEDYVRELILSAYKNAFLKLKPVKNTFKGQTIVKSISSAKRRPS
jgi:Domain of unknown function (DU1801)